MKLAITLILFAASLLAQPPSSGGVAKIVGPRGASAPTGACSPGRLWVSNTALSFCGLDGQWYSLSTGAGTGNVSSTGTPADTAVVIYDGTTGTAVKPSLVTIDGSGNISTPGSITSGATGASTLTCIAAPITPASGKGGLYCDSTSKTLNIKNDAGVVSHTVQTAAAEATKLVSAIADDGTVSKRVLVDGDIPSGITRTIYSGSQALGTSAIAANACATTIDITATGVASTDVVRLSESADWSGITGYGSASTDGLLVYKWPTTNAVHIKVCNGTGTSITPGAATVNVSVTR